MNNRNNLPPEQQKTQYLVDMFNAAEAAYAKSLIKKMELDITLRGRLGLKRSTRRLAGALKLKVTLKHIRPPIWRRLVVPCAFTLPKLHDALQIALGWTDSHLHAFRIDGQSFSAGEPGELAEMDQTDERGIVVGQLLTRKGQKMVYDYDFGDGWEHDIVVEELMLMETGTRARCLDGARACPPEDCGSYPGYMDILKALKAKRKTADQRDLLEWLGPNYDPEQFDLRTVNIRLSGKRTWAPNVR